MALNTTAALFYAGAGVCWCHARSLPACTTCSSTVDFRVFTNAHITPAKAATVPLKEEFFLFLRRF